MIARASNIAVGNNVSIRDQAANSTVYDACGLIFLEFYEATQEQLLYSLLAK